MSDEIAALHGDLFEFVPPKAGTAYERIAALVLATLGWQNVAHYVSEQPVGRCAEHRLDVVAHDSAGVVGRLIVECKDYSKTVGEGTLNTLVGVREQLGAKAAAMSSWRRRRPAQETARSISPCREATGYAD